MLTHATSEVDAPKQTLAEVHNEQQLIELWLHGKSKQSQRAYKGDVQAFVTFCEKPLAQLTLNDVQAFADAMVNLGYSTATQNRRLSAVKSLLAFGHRVGFLNFDVAAPVTLPTVKNTLAERILTELEVITMIALEPQLRNKLLIQFLYYSGARVSEVSQLRWRDLRATANDRGQCTLFGKGGKTRVVLLPASLWQQLQKMKGDAGNDAPVFVSQKKGALQPSQIERLVKASAKRAGIEGHVSPHWLRHSHASHSLDRGAPIQLVQQTLGHSSVATTGKYLHARPSDSSGLYLPG